MNRSHIAVLLALFLSIQSGCDKKDSEQSAAGTSPPGTSAAAAGLPAECQKLTAALAKLEACDKIPEETRMKIVVGYQKMLKVMIESGDPQLSAGCRSGTLGVEQTTKTGGC